MSSTTIPTVTNQVIQLGHFKVRSGDPFFGNYTETRYYVYIKIVPATPTPTTPTGLSATYGQKLSNINLPSGWAWDSPNTSVGDVGSKSFSATFTPSDNVNYKKVTESLTVTVGKATANPDLPTDLTATYGDTLSDVELSTGWQWANENTSVGSVGGKTFSATYTPTDTKNYNAVTKDLTVTVQQATPNPTSPTGLCPTYGQKLSDVNLGSGSGWSWVDSTQSVGEVGTNKFSAKYTPTDQNYKELTRDLDVTVSQASITIVADDVTVKYGDDVPTSFTYTITGLVNGDTLEGTTPTTALSFSTDYDKGDLITGDSFHNITPSGGAFKNYSITSYTNGKLKVEAREVGVVWDIDSYVYDGSEQTLPKATYEDIDGNDVDLTVAIDSGTFKNAGTYSFTASFANDEENYVLDSTTTASGDVEIAKYSVTVPTAQTGLTYNGIEQTGVVDGSADLLDDGVTGKQYTISNNKATEAGSSYKATVALLDTDNYQWNLTTPTSENQEVAFAVARKDLAGSMISSMTSVEFDGSNQNPTVNVTDGEIVLNSEDKVLAKDTDFTAEWKNSQNTVVTQFINKDTYTLTITGKGNYQGTATATYKVTADATKPSVELTLTLLDTSPTAWNGVGHAIFDATDYSEVTIAVSVNGVPLDKVDNNLKDFYSTSTTGNTTTITVVLNEYGKKDIVVKATDSEGNFSTASHSYNINPAIDKILWLTQYLNENSTTADLLEAKNTFDSLSKTQQSQILANVDAKASYEKLLTILEIKAEEIITQKTTALTTAINNAQTSDDFKSVALLYNQYLSENKAIVDNLDEDIKAKYADIEAVAKVCDILLTTPTNDAMIASFVESYESLSDSQKALVQTFQVGGVSIETAFTNLSATKTTIDNIATETLSFKNLTSQNLADVKALIVKFDALSSDELKLVDAKTLALINSLKAEILKIENAESAMALIADPIPNPIDDAFKKAVSNAQTLFDSLNPAQKALVDDTKLLDAITAINESVKNDEDGKKALEFDRFVDSFDFDTATIDEVIALVNKYELLTQEVKDKLLSDTTTVMTDLKTALQQTFSIHINGTAETYTVEEFIELINEIDLTIPVLKAGATADEQAEHAQLVANYNQTIEDLNTALNSLTGSVDFKKSITNSVATRKQEITSLIQRIGDVKNKLNAVEVLEGQHVDDCGLCHGGTGTGSHSTNDHMTAIEDMKIALERLSTEERLLLGNDLATINSSYENFLTYLNGLEQRKIITPSKEIEKDVVVSVYGLATKVDLVDVPDINVVEEVEVFVSAKKSDAVVNNLPDNRQNYASFDVKLFAKAGVSDPVEVQPTSDVAVVLPVPSNLDVNTIELFHVKANGSREKIDNITNFVENGKTYISFMVGSFSDFIITGDKVVSLSSSIVSSETKLAIDTQTPEVVQESDKICIEDENLKSLTLNGKEIAFSDGKVVIDTTKLENGEYTVVATDKFRRQTTFTFTVNNEAKLEPTTPTAPTTPTTPTAESNSFPWYIVLIVVALGTVGVVLFIKTKKHI